MAIEYLENIQAGKKIDLSSLEKKNSSLNPEKFLQKCRCLIELKINDYNEMAGMKWLNKEGMIDMFNHPVYSKYDFELVEAQKGAFASQSNQSVSEWQKKTELNPANLTELALTVILQKMLTDRYIIVRASTYDDYNNGTDQLIIDRETGNVVCGIDEVITRSNYNGPNKKEIKIKEKMLKGGFRVKYGAKFNKGKLILTGLQNIPAFYLSLDKEELAKLSELLELDTISETEKKLFNKLKKSLLAQVDSYEKLTLAQPLLENINAFKIFLESWDSI